MGRQLPLDGTSCSGCGHALRRNPNRKSDLCQPCAARRCAQDPARRRVAAGSMKARFSDPIYVAAHSQRTAAGKRRRLASDSGYRAELCATVAALRARKVAAFHAWCPVEYREEYRRLRLKKLTAREAKKLILDLIAADAARYRRTGELPQAKRAAMTAAIPPGPGSHPAPEPAPSPSCCVHGVERLSPPAGNGARQPPTGHRRLDDA